MASLEKLAIRGIRSFDDKQISVIEFFNPVTVIVGHNGSGKTTIIECLKYATTGDQPPNTRGGAFVHDPKMANEKEVKAQVKLRFNAATGVRMLAVRNLSVTVKKTGLTMKTLESILALADGNVEKGGKRGVISTKCAEMDSEIPQLLGVSKSVLENVIFCHQEDSYWPLAEPSALKKKFDDIFEATRYTKALDSIKGLRKDRLAELKAEKERLEGLSREKGHADKLKARMSDLNTTIAKKEVEREELQKEYDAVAAENKQLDLNALKFREIFVKLENLQAQEKRLQNDLNELMLETNPIAGTLEQLEERKENYSNHVAAQNDVRRKEQGRLDDLEDKLADTSKQQMAVVSEKGRLESEAQAQKTRISDRDERIKAIAQQHSIKGFSHSPLEGDKIVQFASKLEDLKRRQRSEVEQIETELNTRADEFASKSKQLTGDFEGHKAALRNIRSRISERQQQIQAAEITLEASVGVEADLRTLEGDMEEKRSRMEKTKAESRAEKYDEKIAETSSKIRGLEKDKDSLTAEFKSLSGQADSRAKLDLKKNDLKSKSSEIKHTVELANAKLKKLTGKEVKAEVLDREVERLSREKEKELTVLEAEASSADTSLKQAEASISSKKALFVTRKDELGAAERELKNGLEDQTSLDKAIKDAMLEVEHRQSVAGTASGTSKVFESLLVTGKQRKVCTVCSRHMNDAELRVFEKYLKEQMKNTSPEVIEQNKEELEEWRGEVDRLQKLRPVQANIVRLKGELPSLENEIRELEGQIDTATEKTDKAGERVDVVKRELKEIQTLKQHALTVDRLQKEAARVKGEIQQLEDDLSSTGSTRTVGDVELELETINEQIRTLNKESQHLQGERDRRNSAIRVFENDLHNMELKKSSLGHAVHQKSQLENQILSWKEEIVKLTADVKETDILIANAEEPIKELESEYRSQRDELSARLSQAQHHYQELNKNIDALTAANKAIERYVTFRGAQQLQECIARAEDLEGEARDVSRSIEEARGTIQKIDKEINESGAELFKLRENIRMRRLQSEIAMTRQDINAVPLDDAYKARRSYEEKYTNGRKQEDHLSQKVSHITGELSSHQAQLKTWESDMKEFKDIYKRYTDQLIKVKMSDMANNDLEKYAKALDNAIMKYHGLKMEEVNDTMRHLWNKTYQGTDIDGIKIRSDIEGGASKRSYNYRVVMTKDQVEMDMRGRCSAGQKMLASIIIRLALSDSFGQNCGILALDEPTNALDTENIDALAASLVDIINERKNHSNFQLIIITHDENFLRKLGQSDVMEYYWRVSRDARQKSVIERERIRP